ncbi:MAG: beta-ribofuranosylaminobenzene 5'-phosphate synthase [Euryarchaeota archaeon]|nr:beta-ribofuranosylaminobenzene 5'-phosphate synthase [Euryarchaeota archaeon]
MSPSSAFDIETEISRLEDEVGKLSPVQKMLLGTDGSVTRLLRVITGDPVEIETLVQEIVPADEPLAFDLNVDLGDDVNYRVVKLKSSVTGETLIFAVSHTPLKRLDPGFKEDLMRADVPIGTILKNHRIESRREIIGAKVLAAESGLSRAFDVFEREPMLSRNYRIIRRGEPLISITETFPYNSFQDERRIIVETPSRIHLTLTDLAGELGRVDGGVGIALNKPNIVVEAKKDEDLNVSGEHADRATAAARSVMARFGLGGAKIIIRSSYRLHMGLGGGTQMAIAVGKALCDLYCHPATVREIASAVNRGGTSGIGTAAFENGGFIVDGGHSFGRGKEKTDFRPSSASSGVSPPPVIMRHEFPIDWKILLAIPNIAKGAYGQKEVDIFREYCPVPMNDVQEICYQIMMKMVPSILEQDLDNFGAAVNRVQELGFKKVEVSLQHPLIHQLMTIMRESGAACAGLSSFGPTVYAVTDSRTREIESAAREVMEEVGGEVIITTSRNNGARLRTT